MPVGAVGARREIMDLADPGRAGGIYHGGSFNGNVLASVAGRIAVEHLTAERIQRMDAQADRIKQALEARAKALGLSLYMLCEGSVMGLYFSATKPRPGGELPNPELSGRYHLACLNHGVQMGPGGMVSMSTAMTDEAVAEAIAGMSAALEDVRP
jgi:glutamate-1-semialdehyde 2,1-aminomutase